MKLKIMTGLEMLAGLARASDYINSTLIYTLVSQYFAIFLNIMDHYKGTEVPGYVLSVYVGFAEFLGFRI